MMILQLKAYWKKFRTWGLRGIWDYLRALTGRRRLIKRLTRDARLHPYPHPERGITLIGKFTQQASHGKVMRDLARAMKQANISYQTLNTDDNPNVSESEVADILTPQKDFHIRRFNHVVEIHSNIIPSWLHLPLSRIAFWEFESGFLNAYPDMPFSKSIIAMSDFNATHFRSVLPSQTVVTKILYPFHAWSKDLEPPATIRSRYGIAPDEFAVFFNFDFGSSYYRKNPEGAMRAFAAAFRGEPGTRLVLKTMNARRRPELLSKAESLARELGISERLTMIHTYIPERDIFGLTNACDVYISLHRGEGFGLTLAEAMAMGKPVVCTDWSSTTEFCKPGRALPIPYRIVPVPVNQVDHPCYAHVKEWAEPDIDAAASALRRLYDNPSLRKEIGEKARESISEQFSIDRIKASIEAFLDLDV